MIQTKIIRLKLFALTGLMMSFILSSCSDKSVQSQEGQFDEKNEEITQISTEILPGNMIDVLFSELNRIPQHEKEEYLDTLQFSIASLIDSTNKYFSSEELKNEILRFQTEVNKLKSVTG